MQRKQQVGEFWVFVIFFACVCVGMSDSTTTSDDPSRSSLCVMCTMRFPRRIPGGAGMPPWLRAMPQNLFCAVFSTFSSFLI
jgi:hypothetical protein